VEGSTVVVAALREAATQAAGATVAESNRQYSARSC
jgi:hypothetical protein